MSRITIDKPVQAKDSISRLQVCGFKSIGAEQSIEIRPFTILAGANSSGKSSVMQPLLLLKQTLEATYDPGAVLLHGPNARFTSVDQILARKGKQQVDDAFSVGIESTLGERLRIRFGKRSGGFDVVEMIHVRGTTTTRLAPNLSQDELRTVIKDNLNPVYRRLLTL